MSVQIAQQHFSVILAKCLASTLMAGYLWSQEYFTKNLFKYWKFAIERTLFAFVWKYSKRDQIKLLAVTIVLFPLLYLTLELPKRIINDAIGAGQSVITVAGYDLSQIGYLLLLCTLFLSAVAIHGVMKMRINTMKGILSERLLRRFRYTLIGRILRFPAPYFERTSQGELVSMVTSEAEPMGGLMGDALAQPVLQAGQMITVMVFLFAQSPLFGIAACALIPLQAWVIPILQRRINALNKDRILQVRALATEIGEGAVGASTLRKNGGWRYRLAMISDRLGRLYFIRLEIFKKKFFMKFLNNFITQLTPFFFYAIGGVLAIKGEISIGALVSALAAFKDLTGPWKDLLTYYNQLQDMSLRWQTITERFAPAGMLDVALFEGVPETIPQLNGDIELAQITVRDLDGNAVLEDISAKIPAGAKVAITAESAEDRRAFAELLTREVLPAAGQVLFDGQDLGRLHQAVIARRIGHASSQPILFGGNVGENIVMPLMVGPLTELDDPASHLEAVKSANSTDDINAEWMNPRAGALHSQGELRDWWLQIIRAMGRDAALLCAALDQKFRAEDYPDLAQKLVALRPTIAKAVKDAELSTSVFSFEDDEYNPALPVADNLLFAIPKVPLSAETLAQSDAFMGVLAQLNLDHDLMELSFDVIDMLRKTFGLGGTDHPLFRRLGLAPEAYEQAIKLIAKHRDGSSLSVAQQAQLLAVPFVLSAEKIGPAFPDEIKIRVLAMRAAHGTDLRRQMSQMFTPLQADACVTGLSVLENLLFGKISDAAGGKSVQLRDVVAGVLVQAGAVQDLLDLVFDLPLGIGGANLPGLMAEPLALSRAVIKRPDLLILDALLSSAGEDAQRALCENLKVLLPDTTIIFLNASWEELDDFDVHFELKQGRMVRESLPLRDEIDDSVSADLARKVAALKQTDLFSTLAPKQLRLLAFGARWYTAQAGSLVFRKSDDAADGAYMIIQGEAQLRLPQTDDPALTVSTVGAGTLVGELGLIRNEPRALDMVAVTDLTCLRIGAEEFLAVVESDAATAFKLLQVVSGYVSN